MLDALLDVLLDALCAPNMESPSRKLQRPESANPMVRTSKREVCAMKRRRSVSHSFEDQIAAEKSRLETQAADIPPGPRKDALLEELRQLETASHVNAWLTSPGLQPPT
jgi:hypothetical protein